MMARMVLANFVQNIAEEVFVVRKTKNMYATLSAKKHRMVLGSVMRVIWFSPQGEN